MALKPTQIHSKVGGGAIGGAASIVFVWLVESGGADIPTSVEGAITVLFMASFGWLASDVAS